MALKITRASDPITVDRLNLVIYGPPGVGKTSLAFTAEAPLLLDFDNGSHRSANRKDTVRVSEWSDVADIAPEDLAPFKTIVMDTAGRALDALTADIIRANPKHGRGGALTLQGFGELKSRFIAFMKLLNSFGKDVVLVAHMDEQRSGDEVIERLDVQGGSKNEIYKASDAMGRLTIEGGKRWLRFNPTDAAFGKNPGQLEALQVPAVEAPEFNDFIARVIARTKDKLNALTEGQREAQQAQAAFREKLEAAKLADDINALMPDAAKLGPTCKSMLTKHAKSLGMEFDKAEKKFVFPEPVEETEAGATEDEEEWAA